MDKVLTITSGKPFSQVIRVKDAKNIWATPDLLEVRAQLRTDKSVTSSLIANLHDYMTETYDDNDLLILWHMSGEVTRLLHGLKWGMNKTGYFNVVISDLGTVDNRALVVPVIILQANDTTTSPGGLT